ncbi:MAG: tyrosine-type recombinase/integrase [Nitrosomonas sp.]
MCRLKLFNGRINNSVVQSTLADFRWHDLRHTWASWLTQKGVPLNVIQEIGAWESTEMVKRYAHLAPEQFRKHALVVDEILNDTILTQVEN